MIDNPTDQEVEMGYDHSRMLFYRDTGEVSQEVWDVLLYRLLGESNPSDQQALYTAHVNDDVDTKQAIHEHYFPQTLSALQSHVDSFLSDLDKLERKMEGSNDEIHPRLPLLLRHNEFVRQTFLTVKARLQQYA